MAEVQLAKGEFLNDRDTEELDDGTCFIKNYGSVVTDADKLGKSLKSSKVLRIRRHPELPSTICNARAVSSNGFGKKAEYSSDDNVDASTDDEEDYAALLQNLRKVSDENEQNDKIEDTLNNAIDVSKELLDEQWQIEEATRAHRDLVHRHDRQKQQKLEEQSEHTKNQQSILFSLYGTRIHFQQIISLAKRLPGPTVFQDCMMNPGFADGEKVPVVLQEADRATALLLLQLRRLQKLLAFQSKEIKTFFASSSRDTLNSEEDWLLCIPESSRKRRRDLITSKLAIAREDDLWKVVDSSYHSLKPWLLNTADYWASKASLKIVQSFKVFDNTPSAQLKKVMHSDYSRLLSRSRPQPTGNQNEKVSGNEVDGSSDTSAEIYDDSEFYITFLKDIAGAASGTQDVPNSYLELRGPSKEKRKKDVERRASKGRMIRYVPIPELLGFMAPASTPDTNANNSDNEFVNHLVHSLFQ